MTCLVISLEAKSDKPAESVFPSSDAIVESHWNTANDYYWIPENGQHSMDCKFKIQVDLDGFIVDLTVTVTNVSWVTCQGLKVKAGVMSALK